LSTCELKVVLEGEDPIRRPGEVVRGKVVIQPLAPGMCNDVVVRLLWRAHGEGNTDETIVETQHLGRIEWQEQDVARPFAIVLPSEPVSYHGGVVNVDWYVTAEAEVPWSANPRSEAALFLGAGQEGLVGGTYREPAVRRPASKAFGVDNGGKSKTQIIGLGGLVMSTVFSGLMLWAEAWVGGTLGVLMSIYLVGVVVRDRARQQVGAKVTLSPTQGRPGDLITVDVAVNLANGEQVSLTLIGEEMASSGSGSHVTVRRHELDRLILEAGPHGNGARATFTIPGHAAPSFKSANHEVNWSIEVRISLPNFDAVDHIALVVHP